MSDQNSQRMDLKAFRQALGKFATGVTVITTREANGTPRGFTANSFTSVSLEPPLILICIARTAESCEVFCNASNFSVNILSGDQKEISNLFASQRPDKFTMIKWHEANSGTPLIENAIAWFDCSRFNVVSGGDHIILIGKVEDFGVQEGQPLGYFAGNYFNLEIEQKLVDTIANNVCTIMGILFLKDNCVLLLENKETGELTIPEIGHGNGYARLHSLVEPYSSPPLRGSIEFVYSVFENEHTDSVTIYYRGSATGDAPAGHRFFPLNAIPWKRIVDEPVKIMLERLGEEYSIKQFAIYMGDEKEGILRTLK